MAVVSDELMSRLIHECRRLDDEQVADLITRLANVVRDRHLNAPGVTECTVRVTVTAEHSPDWRGRDTGGNTRIEIREHDNTGAMRRHEVQKAGIAPAPGVVEEVTRRDKAGGA